MTPFQPSSHLCPYKLPAFAAKSEVRKLSEKAWPVQHGRHKVTGYCPKSALMLAYEMRERSAIMGSRQSVFFILGLAVLIAGIVFLSRAVEPPRQTEVEVLDNADFQR